MVKPYKENYNEGFYFRTFSFDTNTSELKWHFDEQDRIVVCEHDTDWLIQYDNQLPQQIIKNKEFFIPEGEYHRIIKGNGDLVVKIKKL